MLIAAHGKGFGDKILDLAQELSGQRTEGEIAQIEQYLIEQYKPKFERYTDTLDKKLTEDISHEQGAIEEDITEKLNGISYLSRETGRDG